jgi:flagellar basal-body rod protein FlgC
MVSAINNALSGLAAAGKRLAVASDNIANIHSTSTRQADGTTTPDPYVPKEVQQTALNTGGTQAVVRDSEKPPLKVFDPDNPESDEQGFLNLPNMSLEEQLVQTKIATYDYKANLKSVVQQDKMFQNLLDIIS